MTATSLTCIQLPERLGLSYKDARSLNKIIDLRITPSRPPFERHEIVVAGEVFEVYYRDIIACARALFGNPEFSAELLLAPERHYTSANQQDRVYFDMNTGQWWWCVQVRCSQIRVVLLAKLPGCAESVGESSSRRHHHPHHHLLR